MKQTQPTQEHQVTLEDLLRLKRAERPAPEFWVQFEVELRRKQLAAAIEQRRPWWRFAFSSRILRYGMPAGAAAAVALAWVSIPKPAAIESGAENEAMAALAPSHGGPSDQRAETQLHVGEQVAIAPVATEAPLPQEVVVATEDSIRATEKSLFKESLKIAPPRSHDVVVTLGLPDVSRALEVPNRAVVLEAIADEDRTSRQRSDVWQDSRRARLMAYAESSLGPNQQEAARANRSRERVANRLDQQSLEDSVSRLGMAEGRLMIRF